MKRIKITVENAEYQIISSLKTNRKKRKKFKGIFIEGIESIKQARAAGIPVTRIIKSSETRLSDWGRDFLRENNSAVLIEMKRELFLQLCDRDQPAEILVTAEYPEDSLENLALPEKPFVLIFDRPSDCGNFGSVIRSANSFGVNAIFMLGHGIDAYDPKVIRSSLGSIFHSRVIPVPSFSHLAEWIGEQKSKNGMRILGTDSTGPVSVADSELARPVGIVLGNEAKGMSVALQEVCDQVLRIPLTGAANSLNVACAGTIFLWEVFKAQSLIAGRS